MTKQSSQPLRFNYEFSRVYKRGKPLSGRYIVVHFFKRPKGICHNTTPIPPDINRVGFTGNRRIKGAVRRNRAKRLLRESYRLLKDGLPGGYDFIVMMRYADPLPSFIDTYEDMRRLFGQLVRSGSKTND